MANLVSEIIENEIIPYLDNKLRVISTGAVIDGFQNIQVCNVKWLQLYNQFTNGVVVNSISGNSVNVQVTTPIEVGQVLEIERPKFFHGTPLNTVQEWHEFSTNEKEKLPFIWLVTPTIDNYQDRRNTIERISTCKLFFVHWSNWLELNQNRVNDTIKPLNNLVDAFVTKLNNTPAILDRLDNNGTRKEYPKFGTETKKGIEEVIMNSTLGAISLDVNLKIKKGYSCEC
jgi:hypothetical protein